MCQQEARERKKPGSQTAASTRSSPTTAASTARFTGTDSGRGSGFRRDESRGVTSDFLRLHAPYVPGRGRGSQKPGSQTAASTRSSHITAASMARFTGTNSWRETGCRREESRGVTSDFFGLLPPCLPGRGRGARKTERSRIDIFSRTLGFVSSSAHVSCARNRHRRLRSRCSKAESRGVTADFLGLLPPCVSGRGRGAGGPKVWNWRYHC